MTEAQKTKTYPCLIQHDGHPGMQAQFGVPPLPAYPGAPLPSFLAALHAHTVIVGSDEEADLLRLAGKETA